MKALAIVGSPRVGGNSHVLAEACLNVIAEHGIETECVHLADLNISGCTDCGVCKTEETCSIGDDLWPIYEKMLASHAIIISAPTYFGSAPPEIKALLDRTGFIAHRHGNRFARKVGSPISVSRRAGHNFTFAQLLQWFYINEIVVPGSSYWSIAIGRDPGEVREDEEGIRTIEDLGRNIAWLTALIWGEHDPS
jgi:multimeric flavodoxin WrbA